MTATEILSELQQRGVRLEAVGQKLRLRPKEAVPAEMVELLREHKAELLRLLVGDIKTGYGLCPGPSLCAGCYSVGVVDGRERYIHPPIGRQWKWLQ
jgi:hypothetical protein